MFNFEKLDVWQKARELAKEVYDVTKSFPSEERYGLQSHIRKTIVSIVSNIAEGRSRWSVADRVRFIEIAFGSLYELIAQCYLALDQDYIVQDKFEQIYNRCEEVCRMLNGLRNAYYEENDVPNL